MSNIFKDCIQTFDESKAFESQINELLTPRFSKKQFIKTKMLHAATHIENNMGSEVEVIFCSKVKEKIMF